MLGTNWELLVGFRREGLVWGETQVARMAVGVTHAQRSTCNYIFITEKIPLFM